MTTSYTSLVGLALPVQGELLGTWGNTVNNGITDYLDIAIAGTQTISGSQTAVTLSLTNGDFTGTNIAQAGASGTTGTAQYAIINCTGNPASTLTVTVPASSRQYIVINATSTTQSVQIVGAGPTTGVTIASGEKALIAWNGSDFVKVGNAGGSGSFTDLTVSNNLTLSGGTANGVAYLDGSKVLTTGSALTFDGTNFGLGASSPTAIYGKTLQIASGATEGSLSIVGSSGAVFLATVGATGQLIARGGSSLVFGANDTEQMRLTSTGLGIGTSSPNYSLTSYKGGAVANYLQVVSGATGAAAGNGLLLGVDSSGNSVINAQGAINLYTYVAGVLRTTIDTSGNLGLGVTPSAWGFGGNLELPATNNISFQGSGNLLFNAYYSVPSGGYLYKTSAAAARYQATSGGQHQWFTAPSGTADTAVTFTQTMTLDASGNLTMATGAIREHQSAIAAANIDLSTGNVFSKTISTTTTFTVSNTPSSGTVASFILDITNGGSATVNWWSGVKWPGGITPTLTASGRDSLGFYTYDGGTTWTGLVLGKDIK